MRNTLLAFAALLLLPLSATPQTAGDTVFHVSMEKANTHYYHVELRIGALKGETQDFKMPAWMPGMYVLQDYAKNVLNFAAADVNGKPLPFAKIAQNTWRVRTAGASRAVVSYDVYAFGRGVGNNFLDDKRGYIVGPGLYMHVAGQLQRPAIVTFRPWTGWTSVANGLDPVPGQ